MDFWKELESKGVNVQEGLDRVMGDESLYEMMFDMFVGTLQSAPITLEEFDESDLTNLIGKIHALKGTTGNLSITPLFQGYTEALTLLRQNQAVQAKEVYTNLLPLQDDILDCIARSKS